MPRSKPCLTEEDEGWFDWAEAVSETRATTRQEPLNLALLQLTPRENAPGDRFHLRLTLLCDSANVTGSDASYEFRLRQCRVVLGTEHCRASFPSAYSFTLKEKEWVECSESRRWSGHGRMRKGKIGVDAKASVLSRVTAAASGAWSRVSDEGEKQKDAVKAKRRLDLIRFTSNGWLVGDATEGDPRRGGYLQGQYFNEDPDQLHCAIEMRRGAEQAIVTAFVHVRIGQLDGEVLNALGRPKRPIAECDADDLARALRSRLAGMVVGKALRDKQKQQFPDLPPSEFVLAQSSLTAHRRLRSAIAPTVANRDDNAKAPQRSRRKTATR